MENKYMRVSELADMTAYSITASAESWTGFLELVARLYRYSFTDQLLMYAQRPDATACATIPQWNRKMHCWVNRGASGIALMDEEHMKLRYVFDIADVHKDPKIGRYPVLWKTNGDADISQILEPLAEIYGAANPEYTPAECMMQFVESAAYGYVMGMGLDENLGQLISSSAGYAVLHRCGYDAKRYYQQGDFTRICEFRDRQSLTEVGTAVSAVAEDVLITVRQVLHNLQKNRKEELANPSEMLYNATKVIKESVSGVSPNGKSSGERSIDERFDIQTGGRLHGTESGRGVTAGGRIEEVREYAEGLSEGEKTVDIFQYASGWEVESTPVTDSGTGRSQREEIDSGSGSQSGYHRGTERAESDGLGRRNEQHQSAGGGNGGSGDYQQLELFPSVEEQMGNIEAAKAGMTYTRPAAFSVAQEEIDLFLLLGSNTDEARKIVALEYMKQKSVEEIVPTLKQVYHGGFGLKSNSGNITAWYANDGIHLAQGISARYHPRAQIISWEDVAIHIGALLENGQFATNVELVETPGYEREQLAQSIWYLYRDLSKEAREGNYLAILHQDKFRGFKDETAELAEKLADPQFQSILIQQYAEFRDALAKNKNLLCFNYHKLDSIGKRLNELDTPLREYQTDMKQMPFVRQFITDDEINADLTRGSGFSGGKIRIYEYWQEKNTSKEKVGFLKKEYGTGGHSHACSGAMHSSENHDSNGIHYHKGGCSNISLSWIQVASRLDDLVKNDRFLTEEEKKQRQTILDAKMEIDVELDCDEQAVTEESPRDNSPQLALETDKPFIDHFYVAEDLQKRGALDIKEYSTFEDAMRAYHELPATQMKALGVMNTRKPYPGSLDLIYCKDGQDTIVQDYTKVDGWENPEVIDVIAKLQYSIDTRKLSPVPVGNFHITDERIGEGGLKQKFTRNIEAIHTLFTLEGEKRNATSEEQEILSRYVGFGGLADAFDSSKSDWSAEYTKLRTLLTGTEYAMARSSILNAHYTSPVIIRGIYSTLEH